MEDCCKIAQASILSMLFGIHIANSPSDQGPDQSKDPIGEILNRGELKEIPVLENRFCGRKIRGGPRLARQARPEKNGWSTVITPQNYDQTWHLDRRSK